MQNTEFNLSTNKLMAAYRLLYLTNRVVSSVAYDILLESITYHIASMKNDQLLEKNIKLVREITNNHLSYFERRMIMKLCTPRAFSITNPEVMKLSCDYKLGSKIFYGRKSSLAHTETVVLTNLHKFNYIFNSSKLKRLIFTWENIKQNCLKSKIQDTGLLLLCNLFKKNILKRKAFGFQMFLYQDKTVRNIDFLSRVILGVINKLKKESFQDLKQVNFRKKLIKAVNNSLSFSRLDSFSVRPTNYQITGTRYIKDKALLTKTIRTVENLLAFHLKQNYFHKIKNFTLNIKSNKKLKIEQKPKYILTQQSMKIIDKYSLTKTINNLSDISTLLVNLLTTLAKNRKSRYFYLIKCVNKNKRPQIMPLKAELMKNNRVSIVTRTRMIFLICHRIWKNNLKYGLDQLNKTKKVVNPRMKVAYGKVKDLRRSCTPNREGPTKRVSVVTNEAPYGNIMSYAI